MNAREAATRAEAAASRSQAAADGAKADVAITNAAVKKAHAAAAEAIAASEAAAQNARAAKAHAETATSQAAKAQANAVMARLEATGAAVSAVRTAGFAYATAQAAQAARDSAAQVIKPANDAIELGSPYKETDASAGLAVLTGQAAKTAAEQQRAVAKAKADQAAAAAAESARQAVESADRAGASAAEAAEAAKAAKESEARTVEYDRQATADAEAAQSAATTAGGYATAARESATEAEKDASSARGAADAAEGDAATARGIADKADRDADAAEASAARSRELAKEAEDSATRAERAEDAQRETVRMSDSGPAGASGIVSFTEGLQDTITSDGDCEGSHTGSDVGCEIDVTHHITGRVHFILLTCTLPNTSDAACIGHFTGDYLGSAPIDFTKPGKIHVNGWKLTAEVLKSVATGMVQDYIDCAHGEVSGCAWAAASLAAPAIIKAIGRSVKALRDAIRAGSGIEEALASVRASGINPASLAALERLARAAANCFPAGTPVAVAGGTKKIEDLRVGDRVWAADPRTGRKRLRRITELYRHSADALVSVGTDHGAVRVTPGHPFWVTGKGWTPARDLRAGYRLPRQGGGDAEVGAVRVLRGVVPVFTFEVEGDHTYFAGDAQVLVHNSCQLFKNTMPWALEAELATAERFGITPARPGTAQFDRYIDYDGSAEVIKWAVLEDNSLVIIPMKVKGQELHHSVLSGGAPVRAAGEAQIMGNKEVGYFGTNLTNHSGHFLPSQESLEIGREAFAAAGVHF
ncbi:Hint domain-containing protein [Streptomyces sp. NPDC018019]|uniref:Hint domain-containing protein n=1 Tax=Streptomyces sp. NPDC018019 TaxID=3365030 RepID=UPI0037AAEC73